MAKVRVISFGRKHGTPPEWGDFISCIGLRNPHHNHHLRPLDGRDPRVQAHVEASPGFNEVMLQAWDRVPRGDNSMVTVSFACLGGRHRSVAVAELFAKDLREAGHDVVQILHRDIHYFR